MRHRGFAPVNGANLYYELSGDGQPLVLLHAGVADSDMWEKQVDALSTNFQVLRFDMRGFGRSELPEGSFRNCDDVAALLDHLEIDRCHVIGCSFGGLVAVDFALTNPQRVDRMVLAAPSLGGMDAPDDIVAFWTEEDELLDAERFEEATELNLRVWVDGPHRQPVDVDAHVRNEVGRMQMRVFQIDAPDDADAIPLDPPAAQRLDELSMPLLVLVGSLDRPEKVELANSLDARLPEATAVVIDGAAHMLNMEKPADFNREVLKFLL